MDCQTYISLADELRRVAAAEAHQYLPDADDVEDVAQEVMLRTWERHQALEANKRMLSAYVAKLSRNLCKDRLKAKHRHPILRFLRRNRDADEEPYEPPSLDTPQRRMEWAESERAYRRAMERLPYNWQRILLMRGEKEMSCLQIAQILGTTESSVRGTLSKAKKRMLVLIKQEIER